MGLESWAGSIDLNTRAGALLRKLVSLLPAGRPVTIIFGSAPLQIGVDSTLTSADVDLFSDWEELNDLVHQHNLGTGQTEFYIQVSSELNFRTSPRWMERTQSVFVENCTLRFPTRLTSSSPNSTGSMKRTCSRSARSSRRRATRPNRK